MTLIKSISGIRGIVDSSLDYNLIAKYTQAFSKICPEGPILLARDTRNSGQKYISLATNILKQSKRVSINCDIIPTPTAQFTVKENNYSGGIVFTASHNPSNWNGMKFINSEGIFIDQKMFNQLEDEYNKQKEIKLTFSDEPIKQYSIDSIDNHIKNVINLSIVDKNLIREKNFCVVIDCANGATSIALPKLLKKLNCKVIKINSKYNEDFGRSPEPTPENITELSSTVIRNKADIGFATDPDGDRLSIVDNLGNPLGEELTLGFCTYYFLKYFPQLRKNPIISNLSTSMVSEKISQMFDTPYLRSPVGEINVVKKMKEENSMIGGEGNGGIILKESHLGRDALVGAGIILSLLSRQSFTINNIFNSFPKFYILKTSIPLKNQSNNLIGKIKKMFSEEIINETDGLKITLKNEWIHIRKSNTEPILRIISESKSIERSKELIDKIKNEIN
tara:strand:- start:1833 stop:3182 length:1350 start_codon:yes stop_codon:yes gene_type:complete